MAATEKEEHKFKNVAVLTDDHKLLYDLSVKEQRSMARQMSVLIRRAVAENEQYGNDYLHINNKML